VNRWIIAGVVASTLGVSSCMAIPDEQVAPITSEPSDSLDGELTPADEVIPEFVPDGSAQDNLPYIDYVLTEAGAGTGIFGSLDAVSALEGAGFSRADMEVTSDRTKLELAAESITIAVIIDGECAMGQWGASWYSSSVVPVLGAGTCLLGDTLSLD
jgi:hypothetical protein